LDDVHKICNEKYASMLGYESSEEWVDVPDSFTNSFVAEESRETLVTAYRTAVEKHEGSEISVTWKTKAGDLVPTKVILVPISYEGEILALHFIREL
jgi:hypothetical protein